MNFLQLQSECISIKCAQSIISYFQNNYDEIIKKTKKKDDVKNILLNDIINIVKEDELLLDESVVEDEDKLKEAYESAEEAKEATVETKTDKKRIKIKLVKSIS